MSTTPKAIVIVDIALLAATATYAAVASAQSDPAPALREEYWTDMPAQNAVPSKADPALRTNDDVAACACTCFSA